MSQFPKAALGFVGAVAIALLAGCDGKSLGTSAVVSDAVPSVMAEAPVAAAAEARTSRVIRPVPKPGLKPRPKARRGVVTAADIDDTLNMGAFLRYQKRAASQTGMPRVDLGGAIMAELVDARHNPAPGIRVTLSKPGAAEPFYDGYSGVDGRVVVYPALYGAGRPKEVLLRAFHEGRVMANETLTAKRHLIRVPFSRDYTPEFVDMAFVIDTTGSMGDEIAWLTREFDGLVRHVRRQAPDANIRFGLIAYRDRGDQYVVQNHGFNHDPKVMQRWLRGLQAAGGGDYPEAADQAMTAAADLNWRRGKGERLLFHIADAPAHKAGAGRYLRASRKLAKRGVQVFGLGASGVGPEAEFLMRQAAAQSNGRYLFLTDDSGVGNAHDEPNVACYRVTLLKSLLKRVLTAELSGRRREASKHEIIRSVGSYHNGVCLQ